MERDKGFSLVELIIVIAIMAILVGVLAPQLIKYIEKTNVAADTQLCDAVHGAIEHALADPAVLSDEKSQKMLYEQYGLLDYDSASKTHTLNHYYDGYGWFECAFAQDVIDELGFNPFDITQKHSKYLKSAVDQNRAAICIAPDDDSDDFAVFIAWSDCSGKKNPENYNGSFDELEESNVIFVK